MYYEVRRWLVYTFLVLFAGVVFYGIFLLNQIGVQKIMEHSAKVELQKETKKKLSAIQELNEYKQQNESALKDKASLFLKAFMEIDPTNKQTIAQKVAPYTTEKARAQVVPPGEEQELPSEMKITSKITEMNLYYTPIQSNKASILAKVKRNTSVNNGKPSELVSMVELQMILINEQWVVDNVQLLNQ